MSDSFIEVEPSGANNRVKVKTELLDEREIPVYIQAGADGVLVSPDNPAPIEIGNKVSTVNSTIIPLGIDGVFTGTGEDISKYAAVTIMAFADEASATDGLSVEFSTDNVNWDEKETYSVTANEAFTLQAMGEGNYFRIVYTNGGTAQTAFRLHVIYKAIPSIGEVAHLDYPVTDDGDAQLVRAIMAGKKPNGDYENINITAGGNFKISLEEFDEAFNTLPLPVKTLNSISTANSRAAATLAASATFQGTAEDVSNYGRVGVSVISDNATDGVLTMEVSHDNVTWAGAPRTWADTSTAAPHMWNIVEKYFRILYTNGTTEATNLSIQTQYSNNADIILGHQLDEVLKTETEATVVRPATSFDLDAARRHISGQRSFFFFGFNPVVGAAWEDIHPSGGDINWLTTAGKVEIISSDSVDNGTTPAAGVQSVEVHGLSATGVDQDEIILTNGTAAVQSTLDYIRVNKVHSETCGTYGGSHQGDITCRVTGGGAVLSKMTGEEGAVDTSVQYGTGEAGNGYWTVPLGKVMYITRLEMTPNVSANKNVTVHLYERENILDVTTPFAPRRKLWGADGVEDEVRKEFKSHIKIKALTDVWFRAKASAPSSIEVSLDFYLVDANASGA